MSSTAFSPVLADDAGHLVVIIRNEQPIELLHFTSSLTALAKEHEASLRTDRPELAVEETRLLITDVRKGSIVMEMVSALAPFVSTIEIVNTAVDFVKHMSSALDFLKLPNGRLPDATTQQLKNMTDAMQVIAADSNGELEIMASHRNGEVLQQLVIRKNEARTVIENAGEQRKEIEKKTGDVHRKVLMRLHQTSVEDAKIGKRTSEKGIVERIDTAPHTLVYVSDLAGQRIKEEILRHGGNPYEKGFIVDLDVEMVAGRPRLYRIIELHEVIDLDED